MVSDVKVTACSYQNLQEAVGWFYQSLSEPERRTQMLAAVRDLDPSQVLVATRKGRQVGAIVTRCAAGRVSWLWSPVLTPWMPAGPQGFQVKRQLVGAAIGSLRKAGAKLLQALVVPESEAGEVLRASGLRCITDVKRMRRPCHWMARRPADQVRVECVTYEPHLRGDLAGVMERTYAESLDCPELDGVRSVSEVLEGYESHPFFRPDLWVMVRYGGNLVGCVLNCHWKDQNRCELQYMGVVPKSRGQGIGRALCIRAIRDASRLGASELHLAVDVRNSHAATLYEDLDFDEYDRRSVFILNLTGGTIAEGR